MPTGRLLRSWSARGQTSPQRNTVRVISVTDEGSDLIADSRAVLSSQYAASCSQGTVLVTDDGKTILCAVTSQLLKDADGKREFSDTFTLLAFSASAQKASHPQFTIAGYRQLFRGCRFQRAVVRRIRWHSHRRLVLRQHKRQPGMARWRVQPWQIPGAADSAGR